MIGTLLTIALGLILIMLSQSWWRSHLNPVTIGLIAWMPAMILLNWPPYFLSPLYIHLNRPPVIEVYVALTMAFFSFWAGCAVVKATAGRAAFQINPARVRLNANVPRLYLLFVLGLFVFIYVYVNSGLLELRYLDDVQVAESRLRLHVGVLSFLIIFMDIAAIGLFARFIQGSSPVNLLPMLIAMMCQGATLQKSRFMFLVVACLFVAAIHPRETYQLFWSNPARRTLTIGIGIVAVVALFAMNAARGIAAVQMTAASSPILEQIYIYSGAAAIQNVSVTLEGYLPSDEPAFGLYLARPLVWYLVDREVIFATRYFEGINAATYLVYGWADFRWYGFVITPFLTGVMVMTFLRLALSGTLIGLILGVVQLQALVYSANTDVIFDPTAWILIFFGVVAFLFTLPLDARSRARAVTANLPAPGTDQPYYSGSLVNPPLRAQSPDPSGS